MKSFYLIIVTFLCYVFISDAFAQSSPVALKPGIGIARLMTIHNGAIRVAVDPVSKNIFYVLTSGEIYQVIQPSGGSAYDSLVSSNTEHGVQYVQGMAFFDSTLYISGNNNSNTSVTNGIIARGKLQANGSRMWDTLMLTVGYETADYFDHLFSGLVVSPTGDSIYICSGARGDHGEIQTRYGAYPNLRNVPLTTLILSFPTTDPTTITVQNDSTWLASSGYVYCRGVRNHFDMAFDLNNNLFALENSGDRDHNDEMNWLRRDHHYGFPWRMGDTDNPQQFPFFDPASDSLINHFSRSWRNGFWSVDSTFPPPPVGVIFDAPIQNIGPDADKFRDSLGGVHDASDSGIAMGTFTAHRSPLGLVFDNRHTMGPNYRGDAFMLSWSKGLDSCGCTTVPDTGIGPFLDPSQDLIHLRLTYDSVGDNFNVAATRIIEEFQHPVDADIDSNVIYVIENGYGNTSGLFAISMPVEQFPCAPAITVEVSTPCFEDSNNVIVPSFGALPNNVWWYDSAWTLLRGDTLVFSDDTLFYLHSGVYHVIIEDAGACGMDTLSFTIDGILDIVMDSIHHTTCMACLDGIIYFHAINGLPPYSFTLDALGPFSAGPIGNLAAGNYHFCVEDAIGCQSCMPVSVLQDPTGIRDLNTSAVLVYPNPFAENFHVKWNSQDKSMLRILNSNGVEVKRINPMGQSNEWIDMTGFANGVYTLEYISSGISFVKKLVKIN